MGVVGGEVIAHTCPVLDPTVEGTMDLWDAHCRETCANYSSTTPVNGSSNATFFPAALLPSEPACGMAQCSCFMGIISPCEIFADGLNSGFCCLTAAGLCPDSEAPRPTEIPKVPFSSHAASSLAVGMLPKLLGEGVFAWAFFAGVLKVQ